MMNKRKIAFTIVSVFMGSLFAQNIITLPDTGAYHILNVKDVGSNKILSALEKNGTLYMSLSDTSGNILQSNSITSLKMNRGIQILSFHNKNRYVFSNVESKQFISQDTSFSHFVVTDTLLNIVKSYVDTLKYTVYYFLEKNLDTNFYFLQQALGGKLFVTLIDDEANKLISFSEDSIWLYGSMPARVVPIDSFHFAIYSAFLDYIISQTYNYNSSLLFSNTCSYNFNNDPSCGFIMDIKKIGDTIYSANQFCQTYTSKEYHLFFKLDKSGVCTDKKAYAFFETIGGINYYYIPRGAVVTSDLIYVYSELYLLNQFYVKIFNKNFDLLCSEKIKKSHLIQLYGNIYYSDTVINNKNIIRKVSCSTPTNIDLVTYHMENRNILYPSLFSDYLVIEINVSENNTTFQLFDILGNLVYQRGLNDKRNEINLPVLNKGVYIGTITDNKGKQSFKLVKE